MSLKQWRQFAAKPAIVLIRFIAGLAIFIIGIYVVFDGHRRDQEWIILSGIVVLVAGLIVASGSYAQLNGKLGK